MKFVKFPSRPVAFGVAIIAVLAVALVSSTGLLAPITQLLGRAFGGVRGAVMGLFGKDQRKAAAALLFALALGGGLLYLQFHAGHASGFEVPILFGMVPELWGLKKVLTRNYPILGAQSSASPQPVLIDLKDTLQKETLSLLMARIVGNVTVVGAAPGVATGKQNPEGLLINVVGKTNPSLGVQNKNSLTPRGIIRKDIFERGYSILGTPLTDAAGVQAVDFVIPLRYKQPGAVNPAEWALPLSMFEQYTLNFTFGGREQLFSGGTPPTWDLSALRLELWADFDLGIGGGFHVVEEVEQSIPVLQTQADLQVFLERGYIYTFLAFRAERDNVLVDDIINSITVQSAGRVWTPQGDGNAALIHRWNRETHVNNAAESLTGNYFIPALRDGMYKRAIDALESRVEIKLDVTLGGGATRAVILNYKRILPLALNVGEAKRAA